VFDTCQTLQPTFDKKCWCYWDPNTISGNDIFIQKGTLLYEKDWSWWKQQRDVAIMEVGHAVEETKKQEGGGVGRELWNCYGLRGCPKREWKNTCKMSMNMIEDY
jgi:hypothetical protein